MSGERKERGILFSAPMVRALLAGTKTQTRRAVKPQPPPDTEWVLSKDHPDASRLHFQAGAGGDALEWSMASPYGQAGDRLWVREAWRTVGEENETPPRDLDAAHRFWYEADTPHQPGFGRLRPGMFMPRWASRITLEVTDVRVERLQDISEADAKAEGVQPKSALADAHRHAYVDLWEQINGAGSWMPNPWVWALSFRRNEA